MSNESSCGCGGCGCGSNSNDGLTITTRPVEEIMNQITLKIDGLTCGHCVSSVTEELSEVPGVFTVEVVLAAGGTSTATLTTSAPIENSVLEAAISEAGYTLISTSA
ncbi:metal-binding protein [Arthrobacter sp. MYb227]|uniref:heavy-metal-associated domain-containing protein n=1 Tax=Arthrobacter sp. MYb227 TaxID=1848601 RepID=UPI000CFDFD11|nr:heavy-metal-associated domain-containing protein [Arthrobacter sp. MYb227]PQZ95131.1 metal-binding protein [Arthrobacter sp. MYb227]